MNTAQAKKIPLPSILSKLGFEPVRSFKGGSELAYLSPFRSEKEPSLFVNIHKNIWNDFGDMGGNALDFVIKYKNTDVKGALQFLDDLFAGKPISQTKPLTVSEEPKAEEGAFILEKVLPFGATAPSLVSYITIERKINPGIAGKYLKEVHFKHRETGKKYFAAGFENLSSGFEIRNPYFKGSIGQKDMSLVKGSTEGREVWVFEGFMDFLSKLTLLETQWPPADCLILNSVSYMEKAIEFLRQAGYGLVKGYLDNDRAGEEGSIILSLSFKELFFDMRYDYINSKDINEYIT